jgi:hypothetical protein
MAIIITGSIKDFYVGTTKAFSIRIKLNGEYPNITGDTVKMIWKENIDDSDDDAILKIEADVISEGADGYANFSLTPTNTEEIEPGIYYYDIQWIHGTAEYILIKNIISLNKRVSDV